MRAEEAGLVPAHDELAHVGAARRRREVAAVAAHVGRPPAHAMRVRMHMRMPVHTRRPMRGVGLLGPHQGMPESEACTPCGTIAASDSKLDQMSLDHSTTPCR